MKKIKTQFKAGIYSNSFSIYPVLLITYPKNKIKDLNFAIEIQWGRWGIGVRIYFKH